jgi:hypothetical protein
MHCAADGKHNEAVLAPVNTHQENGRGDHHTCRQALITMQQCTLTNSQLCLVSRTVPFSPALTLPLPSPTMQWGKVPHVDHPVLHFAVETEPSIAALH